MSVLFWALPAQGSSPHGAGLHALGIHADCDDIMGLPAINERRSMSIGTSCCLTVLLAVSLKAAERPRIVGIANFAVKVDNLEEARKFYSGVVGMEEAFQDRKSTRLNSSHLGIS